MHARDQQITSAMSGSCRLSVAVCLYHQYGQAAISVQEDSRNYEDDHQCPACYTSLVCWTELVGSEAGQKERPQRMLPLSPELSCRKELGVTIGTKGTKLLLRKEDYGLGCVHG